MQFLPEFRLALFGGWWFSLLFLAANLFLALSFPSFRAKVLVNPHPVGMVEKLTMGLTMLVFQTGNILPVFMPLQTDPALLGLGGSLFIACFAVYIWAIIRFVQTPADIPVTTGPYRFSRNPQQLSLVLMWAGAGLCLGTWLFALLGLVQMVLAYPGFRSQERYCVSRYGQPYRDYMHNVPRYLFFSCNESGLDSPSA